MIGKSEIKDTPEVRTEPRHEIYIQSGDASREDADRTYHDLLRQSDVQQQELDPETLLFEAQFIPQNSLRKLQMPIRMESDHYAMKLVRI